MNRFFTASIVALIAVAACVPAAGKTLVLCYPGGSVREADAKPATDQMLRVMEKMSGWDSGSFTSEFTSDMTKCGALMAAKPDYAIVSLGFLLQNPEGLEPVVQPKMDGKTTETFRVLVRKGAFKTMDELKGKKISGTPLAEPAFVEKVVLAGKYPLSSFVAEKARGSIKALRDLTGSKIDAVLVTEQQFNASKSLDWARDLEVIFTSKALPIMPLVASKAKTTAKDREGFIRTMERFCDDKEGKQFCKLFGISGFVKADNALLNEARGLWK